jgi:DNA processing protein
MDSLSFWLALKYIPGLGNQTALRLLHHLGSPAAIFTAKEEELRQLGVREKAISVLKKEGWKKAVEEEKEKLKKAGIEVITYQDKRYPFLLKEIYDPPVLLYLKGNADLLNTYSLAIVGTRQATFYGIKTATRLSMQLSEFGLTIVSGLARGIDTAAHKGCLKAGGKTIGVLGCGLDIIYPKENAKLYAEIIEKDGAIISEFPPATPPLASHFPARNRIISGLSLGVVVVEAALKSGSLITARLALEQGREVFAVPGPADSAYSHGTHALIKQGAKLVETAADILEELPVKIKEKKKEDKKFLPSLDPLTEKVLSFVQTPRYLDEIVLSLREDPAKISAKLTMLELQGLIKQLPGKQYVRADKI